ncbi:tetratricopeptide repeat protein [Acidihalobacter ferrooxydans]|uniref:PelB C-terminal domain-containing protein n=1 Tax=Acidihalobacter ferrooxydans TaxID=1765967 RepID=A0A1P8UHR8_9GAMM|nr:tetratricopeptide repeat protein [Acidihalobacter ferrooxydans]APZ43393.1 hypothetical protein BW247_10070 [Acidihalobacter ferrooxydans]
MSVALTLRRLSVLFTLALAPGMPGAAATEAPTLPTRPFQSEDWNLAWQAFIGAGKVQEAYGLALKAVAARPASRLWWQRLAQAARWSSHPQTALEALTRLAESFGDRKALREALNLAIGLEEHSRTLGLLRLAIHAGMATPAERRMLTGLYLDTGQPLAAIRALQDEFRRRPEPELLWEQAVIYRLIGDPDKELTVLRAYQRRYGPTPRVMLAIATREYIQGHFERALDGLIAAQSRAKPSDTAYWETLSGLAWMLGRYDLAARSARVLVHHGKASATLYQRLVFIEQYTHAHKAFADAERGWRVTHDPALFMSMLAIASSLTPSRPWLERAFAELTPDEARQFADRTFYWTSLANLRAQQGDFESAATAYRKALRLAPQDNNILSGYLWLYADQNKERSLRPQLGQLERRAANAPALWGPLAAIYAALDEPQRALPWLKRQWPTHHGDPLWLLNYADTLAQADLDRQAWTMRRRALTLLETTPTHASTKQRENRRRIARARLIATLLPGDPGRRAMQTLAATDTSREARVAVLGAALDAQDMMLARWWREHAFTHASPPAWAALSLALADNDGPAIARLLATQRDRLPRRDRVDAAQRLGWDPLALSLAWQGMQGEPADRRLHRQFRELALPRAASIGVSSSVQSGSGLLTMPGTLDLRDWLSPRDRLQVSASLAAQHSTNSTQLGTPPAAPDDLLVQWRHLTRRGHFDLSLSAGHDLASWFRLGLAWTRTWTDALHTTFEATRGAQPTATVPLSLGGLEDRLAASVDLRLTPRDNLSAQFGAAQLYAQGGGALGNAQTATLTLRHKFWFAPPDFTLDASLSGARYQRATRLPPQLAALVPGGQTPDVAFFVPGSYVQACIGGSFNTHYQTDYAAKLRPFASASVCANSAYGAGYDLQGGFALPLLGPDHLAVNAGISSNFGTQNSPTAQIGLSYRYYFVPLP